jgi:hypothetical protein
MTAISIQLPDSLAKKAGELAERDGVSLDQFISTAVSEKLSGWIAEGNIEQRAARASREKFLDALGQVPDVPPAENDCAFNKRPAEHKIEHAKNCAPTVARMSSIRPFWH